MSASNGTGATSAVSASVHSTGNIDNGNSSSAGNVMAAHAHQYLQAMMHQNGFASFPFPFTGPPGQVKDLLLMTSLTYSCIFMVG